jgi:hypothetical protein
MNDPHMDMDRDLQPVAWDLILNLHLHLVEL